jgi:hypothetical protein
MPETSSLLARVAHGQRAAEAGEDLDDRLASLVLSLHEDDHTGPARWCQWEACQLAAAEAGVGPEKPEG